MGNGAVGPSVQNQHNGEHDQTTTFGNAPNHESSFLLRDICSAGGIFLCPAAVSLSGEKGHFTPDISKRPR